MHTFSNPQIGTTWWHFTDESLGASYSFVQSAAHKNCCVFVKWSQTKHQCSRVGRRIQKWRPVMNHSLAFHCQPRCLASSAETCTFLWGLECGAAGIGFLLFVFPLPDRHFLSLFSSLSSCKSKNDSCYGHNLALVALFGGSLLWQKSGEKSCVSGVFSSVDWHFCGRITVLLFLYLLVVHKKIVFVSKREHLL